ncbi:MAG: gamma-glutamylcyclotransferase, partial [Pseudomonadota bacterium]
MRSGANQRVAYFGYGSLVNQATLRTGFVDIFPASLGGWRRHWQGRTMAARTIGEDMPDLSLLSVHRDDGCAIQGAMVVDLLENLPAVDERESGYQRVALSRDRVTVPPDVTLPDELYVYVADVPEAEVGGEFLLQSYLDAVMQGFHRLYGPHGVQHFVETTKGFERPVIQDRNTPVYPRSVILNDGEAELFDAALRSVGVRFG